MKISISRWHESVIDNTRYPYEEEHVQALLEQLTDRAESPTEAVFKDSPGYTPREMPSHHEIKRDWWEVLVHLNKFDTLTEVLENVCWACGMGTESTLERAHILPRWIGGTDSTKNLHMLCSWCHSVSEDLWGRDYWKWFMRPRAHPQTLRHLEARIEKLSDKDFKKYFSDLGLTKEQWLSEIERARGELITP